MEYSLIASVKYMPHICIYCKNFSKLSNESAKRNRCVGYTVKRHVESVRTPKLVAEVIVKQNNYEAMRLVKQDTWLEGKCCMIFFQLST